MSLTERAARWRAEARRALVLDAASAAVSASAAAFALLALADRALALPKGARLAAFGAWAAWTGALLLRRLWRPWRALDFDAVF
ncbi:MAG: hypothetical protein HY079_07075, partial [Elusimicrobia bacterium]|nr:hypothetical protein [Elusimicrobiota bacterium]